MIEAELKGSKPLLTTGSGVSLELSGLTFRVHYPQQGASSTPPAVVMAAGSAKIDRCAFKVTGDVHPIGSRILSPMEAYWTLIVAGFRVSTRPSMSLP